ncbi:MAG: hypothetical protein PHV23_02055 [Candidatus Gracilibacteria bacterium]|nr:hypothetical protein [Candidatus Gracilibacteria bacterium]
MQFKFDEKEQKEIVLQSKRDELQKLNDVKIVVDSKESDINEYISTFSEDELIDYIYSKIEEDNLKYTDGVSTIRSLSMSEGKLNEIGFMESTITLNLRIPTEDRMFKILDFFIKDGSKYKFFIDSFTYPKLDSESSYNITIPLKIFYK